MSISINYSESFGPINQSRVRTGDGKVEVQVDLPAGKAGELTTRTDANTGVVTVESGHGITTSDTVDVYWDGGRRYGVDVTATTGTTISVDLGTGTDLPVVNTDVVIVKQVPINVTIDGDNAKIVGVSYEVSSNDGFGCRVTFFDATPTAVGAGLDLEPNDPSICDIAGGDTNLYTGNVITSAVASNGDATYAAVLKIIALVDATP